MAQSGSSVAKTDSGDELGIGGNAIVVAMYQLLEASGENSRRKVNGIG